MFQVQSSSEVTQKYGFKRDKTALTFPDQVSRDSYGNPVTPYTTLGPADFKLTTMADATTEKVNKEMTAAVNSSVNGPHGIITFKLPSYAGGITQITGPYKEPTGKPLVNPQLPITDLLPPLEAVVVHTDEKAENTTQASSKGDGNNKNITPSIENEILDSSATSNKIGIDDEGDATETPSSSTPKDNVDVPLPINDLLPPLILPNDQQKRKENEKEATSTASTASIPRTRPTNKATRPTPISVPLPSSTTKRASEDTDDFPLPIDELLPPIISSLSEREAQPPAEATTVIESATEPKTKKPVYSGGFGGAPGILGDNNKRGFAVREDGTIDYSGTPFRPATAKPKTENSPPSLIREPAADSRFDRPVESSTVHETTTEKKTEKPIQKYSGGFGGAPGILGDSNQRGYAVKEDGSLDLTVTSSRPATTNTIEINTTPSLPPTSTTNLRMDKPTDPRPLESELLPPLDSSPAYESATEMKTDRPIQKYSGGFRGAPGILGDSNKRGYAVKEDGSLDLTVTSSRPDLSQPTKATTNKIEINTTPPPPLTSTRHPTTNLRMDKPTQPRPLGSEESSPAYESTTEKKTERPIQNNGLFGGVLDILGNTNKRGYAVKEDGTIDPTATPSTQATTQTSALPTTSTARSPVTTKAGTTAPTRTPSRSSHTTKKSLSSFDTTSAQDSSSSYPTVGPSTQTTQFNSFRNTFDRNQFPQWNGVGAGTSSSASSGPRGTFTSQSNYNTNPNKPFQSVSSFQFGQRFDPNYALNPFLHPSSGSTQSQIQHNNAQKENAPAESLQSQTNSPEYSSNTNVAIQSNAFPQNQGKNENDNAQYDQTTPVSSTKATQSPTSAPNYSQNPFLNPNSASAQNQGPNYNADAQKKITSPANAGGAFPSPTNSPNRPSTQGQGQKTNGLNNRIEDQQSHNDPSPSTNNNGQASGTTEKSGEGSNNRTPYTGIFGGPAAHTAGITSSTEAQPIEQHEKNDEHEGNSNEDQTTSYGANPESGHSGSNENQDNHPQSTKVTPTATTAASTTTKPTARPTASSTTSKPSMPASPPTAPTTSEPSTTLPNTTPLSTPKTTESSSAPPSESTTQANFAPSHHQGTFAQPPPFNQPYNPFAFNPFFNPQQFPGFAGDNLFNSNSNGPTKPNGNNNNQNPDQFSQLPAPNNLNGVSPSGTSNRENIPTASVGAQRPLPVGAPSPFAPNNNPYANNNPFANNPFLSLQPFSPPYFNNPNSQSPFPFNANNPFLNPSNQFAANGPENSNANGNQGQLSASNGNPTRPVSQNSNDLPFRSENFGNNQQSNTAGLDTSRPPTSGGDAAQFPFQNVFTSGSYRPQAFPSQGFQSFQPYQQNLNPFLPSAPNNAQNIQRPSNGFASPAFDDRANMNANSGQKSSNKYTGGFGGPPGIYKPYDRQGNQWSHY